jgi:ArsR family transcriptional regulator, lead/cadmium/zinc/bismuth-responsive transcriptional repressor
LSFDGSLFLCYYYEYLSNYSCIMLLQEQISSHLADLFSALSDPTRLRIISILLDNELNVGDIASQLTMTESAVSHQLRGLRQLRLVRSRKNGRQVYYALDDDHVAKLYRLGLEHVEHG